MIKQFLKSLLSKIGIVNFSLKVAELIVRNYSFVVEIPYEEWTNKVIDKLKGIAEDGKITNGESAEFISFIRTLVPKNIYANFSLRIAEAILKDISYKQNIPYEGWTNDIINELEKASEDGEISNSEVADFIKFVREAR